MENFKYYIYWHFKLKISNGRALKVLNTIESYGGKIILKFSKISNEYATGTLGNKIYTPWLYVYVAIQYKFEELELIELRGINNDIQFSEANTRQCIRDLNREIL